jgi:hypothetical protein
MTPAESYSSRMMFHFDGSGSAVPVPYSHYGVTGADALIVD